MKTATCFGSNDQLGVLQFWIRIAHALCWLQRAHALTLMSKSPHALVLLRPLAVLWCHAVVNVAWALKSPQTAMHFALLAAKASASVNAAC